MVGRELDHPVNIAIDTSDMVYVTNSDNHHICITTGNKIISPEGSSEYILQQLGKGED